MFQNRALVYKSHPEGKPVVNKDLAIEIRDFDPNQRPPPRGITVKVHYVSFDPYQRGRMREADIHSDAAAFNYPFKIGEPITNAAIVSVLKTDNEQFQSGNILYSMRTWTEEYSALTEEECNMCHILENEQRIDPRLFLGALGMSGLTAYSSFYEIGEPRVGETIFVSAAASSVGQVVGQLAKHMGLTVVGSVGDDRKLNFVKDELGLHGVFNYKNEPVSNALQRLAPQGIDIYFDNVGGAQLEAALQHMKEHGRIIACGMISQYNSAPEAEYGVRGPTRIVGKRLKLQGFVVSDANMGPKYYEKHQKNLQKWILEGSFKPKQSIIDGMDNAAEGFVAMLDGLNLGKSVLEISPLQPL